MFSPLDQRCPLGNNMSLLTFTTYVKGILGLGGKHLKQTERHKLKILTLDFTCSGRSVMYERKRIVPRTEPCGTPEETEIFHFHEEFPEISG